MSFFLLKEDGGRILKEDGGRIILNKWMYYSADLINRKSPTGQTAFIGQFIKHKMVPSAGWRLPDGTVLPG